MGGVRRAALLTAGLSLAGSGLGLVRGLAIAVVFGAGPEVDAFLVAQGSMNLVLGLVTGALEGHDPGYGPSPRPGARARG